MWLWCTAWSAPSVPPDTGLFLSLPWLHHPTSHTWTCSQTSGQACLLLTLTSPLSLGIPEIRIHTFSSSLKQTGAPPWGFCQTFYHSHSCHEQPHSLFPSFWLIISLLLGGRKFSLMAPLPPVLQATGLTTPVPDLALTVSFHCSCHLLDRIPVLIHGPGPLLAFSSCLLCTLFCHAPCLLFLSVPQFVQLDACCIPVHFQFSA